MQSYPQIQSSSWYYLHGGKKVGPVPVKAMQALIEKGKVRKYTLVWRNGMARWSPADETDLLGCFSAKRYRACYTCTLLLLFLVGLAAGVFFAIRAPSMQEVNSLRARYDKLQQDYDGLRSECESLRRTAVTPPYVLVRNRKATITFVKTDQSVGRWEIPLESLANMTPFDQVVGWYFEIER